MKTKKENMVVKIEVSGGVCYVQEISDKRVIVEVVDYDEGADGEKSTYCLGKNGEVVEKGNK